MSITLKHSCLLLCSLLLLSHCSSLHKASGGLWTAAKEADYAGGDSNRLTPSRFLLVVLDMNLLREQLSATGKSEEEGQIVPLPTPEGGVMEFVVWKNSVVAEELLEKYPQLQTYQGKGTADIPAALRLENSNKGLQAMVTPQSGDPWYLAPYLKDQNVYMIFDKEAFPEGASPFSESDQ